MEFKLKAEMEHSKKLISSMQKYCKEKYTLEISEGEANEYLNSLGRLFLICAKIQAKNNQKLKTP